MEKIAIMPGSFDPFTKGHESLLRRGLALFDHIVIGVGINSCKRMEQTCAQRINAATRASASKAIRTSPWISPPATAHGSSCAAYAPCVTMNTK